MKKFYKISLLIIIFVFLSTFNPNKIYSNLNKNNIFFSIQNIEIFNNSLVDKDIVLKKIDYIYGKNIFLISRKNIKKSLKNINFLEKVEVKKKYPNTIKIKILETKALGILFKDKTKYLLDSSSNIITQNENLNFQGLPNIIGEGAEEYFVNFFEQLKINKFPTNKIENFYYFQIGRWDLQLFDKKTIKLPYNVKNTIIKKSIELLAREDFKNYKIIDLRVDGKIIVE